MSESSDPSPSSDGSGSDAEYDALVTLFAGGDDSAFGRLIERERPALHAYVEARFPQRLLRRVGVSDVVQQAAIELLRYRARFEDRGPIAFRELLRTIARRVLINVLARERSRKREIDRDALARAGESDPIQKLPGWAPSPSEVALRIEALDVMKRCLSRLSPDERTLIRRIEYEGRTFVELAPELSLTPNGVRKRHAKALERLRRLAAELGVSADPE